MAANKKLIFCLYFVCSVVIPLLPGPVSGFSKDGMLKVGLTQNPPLVFPDDRGKARGLYVEIITHIADEEGWELQFVPCKWVDCQAQLAEGGIDLLMSVAYSEERALRFDFTTVPVFNNWAYVYQAVGAQIDSVLKLKGQKVAVVKGNIHSERFGELLQSFNIQSELLVIDSYPKAFELVASDDVVACVANRAIGMRYEKKFNVERTPIIFSPVELLFATPKGKHEGIRKAIDRHMARLIENRQSEYYLSLDKWFGIGHVFPFWAKWGIFISAFLILWLIFFTQTLRFQIKKRTAELLKIQHNLEKIVQERTAELRKSVKHLEKEILARQKAEIAWQKSEEKLRAIFSAMEDIILIIDGEGVYLDVAPTNPKLLYRPPVELIGRTLHDVFPPEKAEFFLGHIQRTLRTRKKVHIQYGLEIREKHMWFAATVLPMTEDAVLMVARDITDRKQVEDAMRESEEKFRALAQNSPDIIMRFDRALKHLYVNPIVQDSTGIPPGKFIGKTHRELGFPDHLVGIWEEAIQRVFDTKETNRVEFQLPDGIWVDWLLFPEFSLQGTVATVLTSARDITDRKQAEEKLEQAYRELQNTQAQLIQSGKLASIGELAAGVAHELNQPLMVIRMISQSILRKIGKGGMDMDSLKPQFEPIIRNTKRMMNIIKHLRTFSRQAQIEFSPQDINRIIEESFLMIGEQLRLKDIEVKKNMSPDIPDILGNANQLEQVILNLLTNARDAIEAKGGMEPGVIEIATRVAGDNNESVDVLVRDNGNGIPKNNRKNIFDPFFTTKETGKGTGLGLSISYGIIQNHSGFIELAESGPGQTIFRIRLPMIRKTDDIDDLVKSQIAG